MQFTIQHMEDWQNIAETVISKLEHNILLLKGNLGAGKTTFTQFLLKNWEVQMK
jgi:tRNA threonylcarbamoyladenosine biosynthesis protein TsaE